MNEAPNNGTGLNETFSSQPAPQTNPFTADLKGEFTSNFGTNTNAVSQIFKEGGFVSNNRTKYLIIGGVVIAILAVVFFFVFSGDDNGDQEVADQDSKPGETDQSDDDKSDQASADKDDADDDKKTDEDKATETAKAPATAATPESLPKGHHGGADMGSGTISLTEPADGSSLNYDETQGPASFSWTGGGGYIVFSRNQSMHPVVMRMPVSGNSYSFNHPWPGNWYWKVQNKSGSTEVRSFKVNPPARRNISLSQPSAGGSISGNGGTVSWQGDSKVAYYRVELTNGGWANPTARFSSSGNSVQLQGVAAGQYQMRIGAFSEVAGRWEYANPIQVTVQ